MKTVAIEGQLRNDMGKKATRDLRNQGMVPAVIYGGEKNVHFFAPILAFRPIVYTPDFLTIEVKVGEKKYSCILKDLQFDVVTESLTHVDFQELIENRKITADIPVRFNGLAVGVREGGSFQAKMKSLRVRTYPKYLVGYLEVDITNLKLTENIRVEDVQREHLEILNAPRQPIATVALTRTLRQAAVGGEAAPAVAGAPGAAPKEGAAKEG